MPDFDPKQVAEKLAVYRNAINKDMAKYFDSPESRFDLKLKGPELEAFEALRDFTSRPGKRLRGALVVFAYEQFAKKPGPSIYKAAVAIELIQNYLLIIDDVMDRSTMRRGKPTVHQIFIEKLKASDSDAGHLGDMMGVNVGLLAQHMAADLLYKVKEKPGHVLQASALFQKNILMTAYGQIDDLYSNHLKVEEPDEARIINLHELKNGYYTFVNPLQLGAALAGMGDQKVLNELLDIGLPAGVAFQLQDDILGMFGDEQVTGKPASDDLREGKFTLLIRYALDHAKPKEVAIIRKALGNPKLTSKMHAEVQNILESCGAHAYVTERAEFYCQKAQGLIMASKSFDPDGKKFLCGIVDYVVNRSA